MRMVVQQGMATAAAGIAVGTAAALGMTRVMGSLLYEIAPTDGPTFGAVCGVLAAAAFLACCLPALRASKVDPVVALRYEYQVRPQPWIPSMNFVRPFTSNS